MAKIFISHSSRDNSYALEIISWLKSQGYEETFLDFDKHQGIEPGADWEKTLYREIERANALIIIVTSNWFDSKWCFAEYAQARALGKAIFPILIEPNSSLNVSQDIQHINISNGLESLAKKLKQVSLDGQRGFPWDPKRSPYPGLISFEEEDAAVFFGRDEDIRRVVERLEARRVNGGSKLLVMLGASGAGKSSILRAGIIPRLKLDRKHWIVIPAFRPKSRPVYEFAGALVEALGLIGKWPELYKNLIEGDYKKVVSRLCEELRTSKGSREAQILISIDQAEELFEISERAEAVRFFNILNHALANDQCFIGIMALRSDYLGYLQKAESLDINFDEISLKPIPLEQLPQVIKGPASVNGLRIDDALVVAAQKDAETEDALPLLAFALRELYEVFGRKGYLSLIDYQNLGDQNNELNALENAVKKAANNVLEFANPSKEELQVLHEAFVPSLVRLNNEGDFIRRTARWNDLPAHAHDLLEKFAKARLLVIRHTKDEKTVEVAHESLLRNWPTLNKWLNDDREFLYGRNRLEENLEEWRTISERDDALITGRQLKLCRQWLNERPHQLTTQERRYIQRSITKEDKELKNRLLIRRVAMASIVVFSFISIGLAAWALKNASALENSLNLTRNVLDTITEKLTDEKYSDTAEYEPLQQDVLNDLLPFYKQILSSKSLEIDSTLRYAQSLDKLAKLKADHTSLTTAVDEYRTAFTVLSSLKKELSKSQEFADTFNKISLGYAEQLIEKGELGEAKNLLDKISLEHTNNTKTDVYKSCVELKHAKKFRDFEKKNKKLNVLADETLNKLIKADSTVIPPDSHVKCSNLVSEILADEGKINESETVSEMASLKLDDALKIKPRSIRLNSLKVENNILKSHIEQKKILGQQLTLVEQDIHFTAAERYLNLANNALEEIERIAPNSRRYHFEKSKIFLHKFLIITMKGDFNRAAQELENWLITSETLLALDPSSKAIKINYLSQIEYFNDLLNKATPSPFYKKITIQLFERLAKNSEQYGYEKNLLQAALITITTLVNQHIGKNITPFSEVESKNINIAERLWSEMLKTSSSSKEDFYNENWRSSYLLKVLISSKDNLAEEIINKVNNFFTYSLQRHQKAYRFKLLRIISDIKQLKIFIKKGKTEDAKKLVEHNLEGDKINTYLFVWSIRNLFSQSQYESVISIDDLLADKIKGFHKIYLHSNGDTSALSVDNILYDLFSEKALQIINIDIGEYIDELSYLYEYKDVLYINYANWKATRAMREYLEEIKNNNLSYSKALNLYTKNEKFCDCENKSYSSYPKCCSEKNTDKINLPYFSIIKKTTNFPNLDNLRIASPDETFVILLQGKSGTDEHTFSYLRMSVRDLPILEDAIIQKKDFRPADYGIVLYSGIGDVPEIYRNRLMVLYDLVNLNPKNPDSVPSEEKDVVLSTYYKHRNSATQLFTIKKHSEAADQIEKALEIARVHYRKKEIKKLPLIACMNHYIYYFILDKRFHKAEKIAKEALILLKDTNNKKLKRMELILEMNQAHALLFLGNKDKAKKLYLKNSKKVVGNINFSNSVKDDFKAFREAGIENTGMTEIEHIMKQL
ncbi:MAG: toll/interleukin-1 receptor domain-containing protein [Methylococcaceae bacterium]